MVTIYSTPNCSKCKAVKKSLIRLDINYTDVDITAPGNEEARERVAAWGYNQAPVIEANGEHWSGYDPEKLASLK